MRFNKFLVLALLAALLIGVIGVSAQDNVTLVLWHATQDAEGDGLLAMIDAFNAANPGITVEQVFNPSNTILDSFRAAAGAGEGPDILLWANDSSGEFATKGLISDISTWVDDDLKAQVTDSGWGTFTYEGKIYGVPVNAKTLAFFYNKSLVPDAPKTWADVLKISKELAADGVTGLGFQNGFFHSAGFLYALGGALMDDKGNATFGPDGGDMTKAMEAYLQLHQDMYNLSLDDTSGVIIDGTSPLPGFQTGEVAMVYDGIWNLAQFEKDLGDDLGVAIMPALDNGNVPALFAQTTGFMANANMTDSAKQDAFVKFMKFVTGEEGQNIGLTVAGWLPVNPNVKIDSDPNLQVFADQFALGTPFPNRAELSQFWGPMADAITAVSAGGETPAEATSAAYDIIQKGIDEMHTTAGS